ncbi:hypothetical protein GCM10007874_45490 [Labrys miyagiensis]|uniref:Lipoprotein n=1 Tax=Labrys miyagiensis TaxID=346912 RepID=A0ABQ6CPK7_9HYPH|nr:hypothetical protein GCM10007874_45490 [Labrys miyagiensis]
MKKVIVLAASLGLLVGCGPGLYKPQLESYLGKPASSVIKGPTADPNKYILLSQEFPRHIGSDYKQAYCKVYIETTKGIITHIYEQGNMSWCHDGYSLSSK